MPKRRKQTAPPRRQKRRILKPKTENQAKYIREMSESDLTFCSGPAGSGKTSVAVGLACEYMTDKKIEKIIITRPVVESGRGLGHLPGTLIEKINPYLIPILEEMALYLTKTSVESYRSNNIIELCPLEYMRGRNFHNCFMILDEAQNATFEQIKMFITRIGRESKAVINGDLHQTDLKNGNDGGLKMCMDKLVGLEGVSICELDYSDIVRNDIISKILLRLKS
jgi:phosphate starvation-inducible PhoH-like protein|tara:strand:+ start:4662 stop:5333 length:672 start_codon:yes stop_codon:yes gene_type:complete